MRGAAEKERRQTEREHAQEATLSRLFICLSSALHFTGTALHLKCATSVPTAFSAV